MKRVKEVYEVKRTYHQVSWNRSRQNVCVSDIEVMIYISQIRMRFYIPFFVSKSAEDLQQLVRGNPNRFSSGDAVKLFRTPVYSLPDALKWLARNEVFIQQQENVAVKYKEFSERRLFLL